MSCFSCPGFPNNQEVPVCNKGQERSTGRDSLFNTKYNILLYFSLNSVQENLSNIWLCFLCRDLNICANIF